MSEQIDKLYSDKSKQEKKYKRFQYTHDKMN